MSLFKTLQVSLLDELLSIPILGISIQQFSIMIEPYKKKALSRLKRARGQIDGVIRMIESSKYCADVITQVLALQGALKGVNPLILESHLTTCGAEHLNSKDKQKREKFIREIVRASELSHR